MKRVWILLFCLPVVLFAKPLTRNEINNFIRDYMIEKTKSQSWLVQIDDYVITREEFEQGFNFFLNQIPEEQKKAMDINLFKKEYLETLISQTVLIAKALDEDIFKNPTNQALFKFATKQTIYQIFINNNLPADKSIFLPTAGELEAALNQNRENQKKLGYTDDQMKQLLAQEIYQRKAQMWMQSFIDQKKQEYRIKRNQNLLQILGIN